MNSLDMQVVHITYHIITAKYKNFKMTNLIYMIFILNSIFTIMLYEMRWIKQDLICICLKEFLN
jgi:hypothetical protein